MGQSPDTVVGAYRADLGAVVGHLQPQGYERRIVTLALVGPAGSAFALYRGYLVDPAQLVVTTGRGQRNTYDAAGAPILVRSGEAATAVWSGGGATDPTATGRLTIVSEV